MDDSTGADILQHLKENGWNNRRNSDVTLEIRGEEFHLHKVILEISPYFKSMFSDSWNHQSSEVRQRVSLDTEEMTPKSTRQALQYLYGYRPQLLPNDSVDEIVNLFQAASFFGIERLRTQCQKYLLDNIRLDNVHLCYKFFHTTCTPGGDAILLSCKSLLLRLAHTNPACLVNIPREVVVEILNSHGLCVPGGEYDRYKFIEQVLELLEQNNATAIAEADSVSTVSETSSSGSPCPDIPSNKRLKTESSELDLEEELDIESIRQQVLPSLKFSAFSFRELNEAKRKKPCAEFANKGLWKQRSAQAMITDRTFDPQEAEDLEEHRTCIVFKGNVLRNSISEDQHSRAPHSSDVYSDPFVAFGSMWTMKARLVNKEGKKSLSCHLHRAAIPKAEQNGVEYTDPQLMRKFKFSFYIPPPKANAAVREGTVEFALKSDNRLPPADANKYGWGWDNLLEYSDVNEILTDDKLMVIVTICPVFKA